MVAKLITFADTREEAVAKMKRALSEFVIDGVHTTIPFHAKLMDHEVFKSGDFDTKFLEKYDVMNS
jgi:acetyl-CoA carboxylase, biotin carboxylase subunit